MNTIKEIIPRPISGIKCSSGLVQKAHIIKLVKKVAKQIMISFFILFG